MKGKMKRRMLCVMLVCALCLSACGEGDGGNAGDVPDGPEEYVRASLFCDVSFWEYPAWEVEAGTITGDITERTGLALDVMQPTQDADIQLRLMLLGDELPDIISVTDSVTIRQLVSSGKVWRIDEFLEIYKPDSHILRDFPEDVKRELIRRDGAWYAFPSHINSADAREQWMTSPYMEQVVQYNDNNAIIWNRELLERAGLDAESLETQEEVLAAFEKVKNMEFQVEGEDVIVLLVDGKNFQDPTLKFLEWTFGAEWVDEDGNFRDILLQPQARNALAFLNLCIRSSYAAPEQLTMETTEIQELMQSGRVLCFIGNVANTAITYQDWVSTGVILSPDGSSPVFGKSMRATVGWISTFIARDCAHPEETAAFLDYMTGGEGMALWNYGREGTDYYVGEDGCYHRMQGKASEEPEGLGIWWMFCNSAWARSVQEISEVALRRYEIETAYGMHPATVTYDSSLLLLPSDLIPTESAEGRIEKVVAEWKDSQIVKEVLAESEKDFEREYGILIQGLYERGIARLDERRDDGYQENCREYGSRIRKVNRTEGAPQG